MLGHILNYCLVNCIMKPEGTNNMHIIWDKKLQKQPFVNCSREVCGGGWFVVCEGQEKNHLCVIRRVTSTWLTLLSSRDLLDVAVFCWQPHYYFFSKLLFNWSCGIRMRFKWVNMANRTCFRESNGPGKSILPQDTLTLWSLLGLSVAVTTAPPNSAKCWQGELEGPCFWKSCCSVPPLPNVNLS